ncbi:e3 ubiquitin-protein ligase ubr7-like [Plasmopara halstedii]|uniref:E3 ubiquitin-protein ligase ubr7-like n=1 Tax=Plasmopara halstedii TaxID=4781 RepID=A0A0P1AIU2_PLAHL|nr:e3 ubiquitin-protein ligase ubr7-like [Plasmopara halstedii]CEG40775.1 e3 ubiquitin-protein ligase ubr7-like [Plasmopara halstedii]|eukprot:XP_024577144.1 e3 ubiquitin-protein ligase ubr7-like [Plasmopara halstedii]
MESSPVASVTGNKRVRREIEPQDEEEVVTLSDVLKHNEQMTEAADAVLGDASDTHCSYPMGYMRQAVYACLTCTPDAAEKPETRAGVCLACTYNCHQDHELLELYTKRSFRCDCGNGKFPTSNPCKLEADKVSTNSRNTYIQNFGGLYCNCHRPYPDPERTTPEVMIQCVICEDWLHEEHIFENVDKSLVTNEMTTSTQTDTPATANADKESPCDVNTKIALTVPQNFDELICFECMKKHPFLMVYTVDCADESLGETSTNAVSNECTFKVRQRQLEDEKTIQPTFWSSEWRSKLCNCSSCVALFENHKIAFLLDPEDSLHVYEASARAKKQASDEEVAHATFSNKLTHEQQVEVAMGYSLMKNNLQQYLAGFAATGKMVRKEDIQTFFEGLNQAKKQKTE